VRLCLSSIIKFPYELICCGFLSNNVQSDYLRRVDPGWNESCS